MIQVQIIKIKLISGGVPKRRTTTHCTDFQQIVTHYHSTTLNNELPIMLPKYHYIWNIMYIYNHWEGK